MKLPYLTLLALAACVGDGDHDRGTATGSPTGTALRPEVPPHVVLIVADDMGWTGLSSPLTSLGHPSDFHRTPALDALAERGVAFPHGYASTNSTPARAALMTGLLAQRTGNYTSDRVNNAPAELRVLDGAHSEHALATEFVTLAEHLRTVGYRTGHFGKWDLGGDVGAESPTGQGFDINVGGNEAGDGGPTGGSDGNFATAEGAFEGMPNLGPNGVPYQFMADRLTDEALAFLADDLSRPALLHIAHFSPHHPIQAPDEDLLVFEGLTPGVEHDDPVLAAMVYNLDRNVGRLVDYLEQTDDPRAPGWKLIDSTIIVFLSDNGGQGGYPPAFDLDFDYMSQAPLSSGKGSLFEGGIRVPFIVRWDAAGPGGHTSDVAVQHIDVVPTVLEAVGIAPDPGLQLDGLSLVPLLRSPGGVLARDTVFQHFPCYNGWRQPDLYPLLGTPTTVMHRGDWKLWFRYETRTWALYDLSVDLAERDDLAAEQPEVVFELATAMRDWLETTGAAMPLVKDTGAPVPLPEPPIP